MNAPVGTVREATEVLFRRYLALTEKALESGKSFPAPDDLADLANLCWMCRTALAEMDAYPIDKLSRWLGFVQGVLVMHGLVHVDEERDFSRPLFHAAYAAEGMDIPPTRHR